MNLQTQLWINHHNSAPLGEEKLIPVENEGNLGIKGKGGLWTSTFINDEIGSEWVQWSIGSDYFCPADWIFKGYLLEPKENLSIFVIDSTKDMHKLFDQYGYQPFPFLDTFEAIDFEKLSKKYDAIHLTKKGQWETRYPSSSFEDSLDFTSRNMRTLYGWDSESTFHFRWNFKSIKPISFKKI